LENKNRSLIFATRFEKQVLTRFEKKCKEKLKSICTKKNKLYLCSPDQKGNTKKETNKFFEYTEEAQKKGKKEYISQSFDEMSIES
jgi:hypothetical protein